MTNEIVVPQTFEEKMKKRIKESIGELITDEELGKLVRKSVDQVFFEPTRIKSGFYDTKEGPSLLNGLIKELLTPQVKEAIQQYINDHPEEIIKAVKEVLAVGMGGALLNAFNSQFQGQLFTLQSNIENMMANR